MKDNKSRKKNEKKIDLISKTVYFFSMRSVLLKNLTVLFILVLFSSLLLGKSHKRKTFVFKEIEIKGKIQKPEAMYFLSRARFQYKVLDLDKSFVDKVKKAVLNEDAF